MPIESFVTTASHFPVSHLIEPFFSDDPNKVGICLLCRSTQLDASTSSRPRWRWVSTGCGRSQSTTTCESSYVLQSTTPVATPVLICITKYYSNTTKYYSSTTLYYKVLRVLLCTKKYYSSTTKYYSSTTKCYSSTTKYYSVLLQYYSVLQSTIPVLLRTTKYYSSTTLHYKVLQSTTPVLLCTTKYYSSTTLCYKVLLQYYSNTTLYYKVLLQYYKVLLQYYNVLQRTTPVLLCTTKHYTLLFCTTEYPRHIWNVIYNAQSNRGYRATSPMPRKVTLMNDPRQIWNVIYKARSNRCHLPTSPNTAPATKIDCHDWSASHMKRYLLWMEQQVSSSNITKYCACHDKWLSWLIGVTYETLFNARSNKCHPPTSPNTLPATQNDPPKFHRNFSKTDETSFAMRDRSDHDPSMMRPQNRQSATRLRSPRACCIEKYNISRSSYYIIPNFTQCCTCHEKWHLNFTKYCACHGKWLSWLILVTYETLFTMPGATGVIFQHHQILRLPRELTVMIDPHHIWNVIYYARSKVSFSNITKYCACHEKWLSGLILVTYETWFTMRRATHHRILRLPRKMTLQNFTEISAKQLKRHLQRATDPSMIRPWSEHVPTMKPSLRNPPRNRGYFSRSPRAFCIEKYNISRSSYHSKFHAMLHLPRKVTRERHQILRLPHKMTLMIDPHHIWNVIYNARSNRGYPPTSPDTAPATQNDSHDWSASHMKRYYNARSNRGVSPTSPNIAPATQNESLKFDRNFSKADETSFLLVPGVLVPEMLVASS